MKKILSKYSVLALMALPVATSCELDQLSPTNPGPEEVVNTVDDAESWRLGLYDGFRAACGFEISDIQTDNFVLTNQDGNAHGLTYSWQFLNSEVDDQTTVWSNAYTMIRRANDVLAYVPQVLTNAAGTLSAADSLEINQILGEAYLTRAIFYEQLATYFMDRYDPATVTEDLGLPIFDEVDVDAMPARVSADSVYRHIEADLAQARRLMNGSDASQYLNNQIADYLLPASVIDLVEARVALTTQDYERAASLAAGLIESGQYPLITTVEGLQDMWANDRGSEIMFQIYQSTDERGFSGSDFQGLDANLSSQVGDNAYVPQIYPSYEALSLYDATDIRFQASFFQGWSYAAYSETFSINSSYAIMLNKFPGNSALKIAATDTYNMKKLFRVAEAYLIAAEAEYRQGHTTEALAYYNALHHTARGAAELTTTDNFIEDLCNEYTREFIGEGRVFSAYKRLNKSVVRSAANQQMGTQTGGTVINIEPDNIRWTWNIPQQDLNANPNLVGNW